MMRVKVISMRGASLAGLIVATALVGQEIARFTRTLAAQEAVFKLPPNQWNRPEPIRVTVSTFPREEGPRSAPSDAIVLFNGRDLSDWQSVSGGPARWKVGDGYFQVVPGTGNIETKQTFKDFQLHVEWTTPYPPSGEAMDRGNSGVFLQGLYEVQIFDSYDTKIYPDGVAGAMYGQYPPLVNACRPPGAWQSFDIIFHAPQFMPNGSLLHPARVTVFENGVLVQDNVPLTGPTRHLKRPPYEPGVDRGPIMLQEHGSPVRFRNLWIRKLKFGTD